ncbi:RabGAP-TBC domain containing protein [Trichuris trichiura]|uniref:RabGAP-TBC domain containing protein n=1 Tax=Trichuris trichiura TaxID=36087 RepID=A0A077Z083_TRITR|nr:RabGAP-TBC domain containing protein [Trichuris trichiura]
MNPMCQAPKFYWLAERLFCVSPAERSIPVPNGANCLASCDCLIPFACFNRTPITGLFRAQSSEASTGESLFLSCLPLQIEEWAKALAAARQYYSHLLDYISQDPRSNSSSFHSDHPLSLEEDSCWKQHFMDQELKSRIRQDVNRTFPGIEYFGSAAVRETMCRLLFIYAKENPHISYKQGMHEIVGPIMFVFYSDQQAFKHIDEQLELRNVFLSIMKILQPFYFQGEVRKQSFDSTDGTATCPLLAKLEWIMGTLKVVNEDLYEHLKALQVPPEAYGIRWMRLLFGREFPLQDLLLIWDTIFAKSPPYQLIECIFVQMLCWIAPVLLQSDYTGCLQRLMKFPTVMDVLELLRRARRLESDIEKGCLNRVINFPVSERSSSKTKGDSIFGSVFPRRSIDSDRHALPAARQFAPPAIINAKLPNVYAAKREAVVRTSRELAKQSEPPEKTRHRPSDTYEQFVCLQRRCNYAADEIDRCVESMESTARNVDENNGIYLKKMAAELASVSLILKENKCLEKSSNNQNRLPPKRVDGAVEIARESLPSDSIIEEMPTSARLMLKKENMLQVINHYPKR